MRRLSVGAMSQERKPALPLKDEKYIPMKERRQIDSLKSSSLRPERSRRYSSGRRHSSSHRDSTSRGESSSRDEKPRLKRWEKTVERRQSNADKGKAPFSRPNVPGGIPPLPKIGGNPPQPRRGRINTGVGRIADNPKRQSHQGEIWL